MAEFIVLALIKKSGLTHSASGTIEELRSIGEVLLGIYHHRRGVRGWPVHLGHLKELVGTTCESGWGLTSWASTFLNLPKLQAVRGRNEGGWRPGCAGLVFGLPLHRLQQGPPLSHRQRSNCCHFRTTPKNLYKTNNITKMKDIHTPN